MTVNVVKFSQFANAGNLNNGNITVGLNAGNNAQFTNPWTFLPPGNTADRPLVAPTMYYQLRLNTDLSEYEYYNPIAVAWVQLQNSVGSFIWNTVVGPTQSMLVNNGYMINYIGGQCVLTLPVFSQINDIISIVGFSAGGYIVTQAAGQSIVIAPVSTTVGIAGSISPLYQNGTITLICTEANLSWEALGAPQGIFNYV